MNRSHVDHDRLFKELLTIFFLEFLALFFPDVLRSIDGEVEVVTLDKELFTDVTTGEVYEADLIFKVKFLGRDTYFLIHIEHQSTSQTGFPKRYFRYYTRIEDRFDLPVYPIVIFSYDKPLRPEPNHYSIAFSDLTVLQFEYRVIQLNRYSWRDFITQPNPVAAALMSKMRMLPGERAKVKAECLRLLVTLKLNPAKMRLISGFVESYLKLTAAENGAFLREIETFPPQEKEAFMEIMLVGEAEGRKKGRREGRAEGRAEMVLAQVRKKLGTPSAQITEQINRLSLDQLQSLGLALLDFEIMTELDDWLQEQIRPA